MKEYSRLWQSFQIFYILTKTLSFIFQKMIHDLLLWILDHGLDDESACLVCPSSTVNLDAIQQICDLITENGGGCGINAYDVRCMVNQMNLGTDDIRALSSRIFYNSYFHNFDLIVLSGKRHFDSSNSAHIYDAERNENFLLGDSDF